MERNCRFQLSARAANNKGHNEMQALTLLQQQSKKEAQRVDRLKIRKEVKRRNTIEQRSTSLSNGKQKVN